MDKIEYCIKYSFYERLKRMTKQRYVHIHSVHVIRLNGFVFLLLKLWNGLIYECYLGSSIKIIVVNWPFTSGIISKRTHLQVQKIET